MEMAVVDMGQAAKVVEEEKIQLRLEGFQASDIKAKLAQMVLLLNQPLEPGQEVEIRVRARYYKISLDFDDGIGIHELRPVEAEIVEDEE